MSSTENAPSAHGSEPAFQLDPFQQEAIRLIGEGCSLLVSAPTGAGKTVIAERAIEQAMARGERAVYTAPIKALSNQKYRDFQARYGERVGILTGDVSINAGASLVIMTTEIYRNTLFEDPKRVADIGWVIFDEVHYLDDPERGTVWEEAILFSPRHVRILALSATIPNAHELAAWIGTIHGSPVRVVTEEQRPVPLVQLYQSQNQMLKDHHELKSRGYQGHEDWARWRQTQSHRHRGGGRFRGGHRRQRSFGAEEYGRPNRVDGMLRHLIDTQQLPCLFFVFGRRRAEQLAWELVQNDLLDSRERSEIHSLYKELCTRYQLGSDHTAYEMEDLVLHGIAYHHAGMLPTLKEVIERLFTSRLIKLIFTTETFALGIKMPARSVVFDELIKHEGPHMRPLTTREYYQMAGRAGRRGIDEVGYVYARVNPNRIAYPQVVRIIQGRPEPVMSRFNLTYATILNLYRQHREQLLEIYPRSFHAFQSSEHARHASRRVLERKLNLLKELGYIGGGRLTPKGDFASGLFGYEMALGELYELGLFDRLTEEQLASLLAALVFEPRKGDKPPRYAGWVKQLAESCHEPLRRIHRRESMAEIHPYTKQPFFNLAPALEAWMRGAPFEKLEKLTTVDDGELVRAFRMVIQLLRELSETPFAGPRLQATARKARERINRGVVDAEAQLRTA